MAKKNLTARPSSPRNSGEQTIHDAIEAERARLMTAEAILHCVVIALDDHDPADLYSPTINRSSSYPADSSNKRLTSSIRCG